MHVSSISKPSEFSLIQKQSMTLPLKKSLFVKSELCKQDAKVHMEFHYGHTVVMAENNGRFLSWTCQRNNGFLRLNGLKLTLRRFIIHTPAEHVIDGHRAQLELQLFHSTHPNSNRYSVISILFEDSGNLYSSLIVD